MKRLLDMVLSLVALVVLAPLFILIIILIFIDTGRPIFFCQRRAGVEDKEFMMYKFRTMVNGTPEVATDKLTDSGRYITSIGSYLRKYSLDELPQLYNILRGDMSLVGPRPALYNQYNLRVLRNKRGISKIRPGLTGWAQINGRDEIPLEAKIELDWYYLNNKSLLLDLKIVWRTIFSVYSGNG